MGRARRFFSYYSCFSPFFRSHYQLSLSVDCPVRSVWYCWYTPPAGWKGNILELTVKTQGEIEAAICEGISRFQQEYMGRGPKDIYTCLIGNLLVVRLQGVLTAAEQQLVMTLPAERGRDLLKQVRTQLIETARPVMEKMVEDVTGVKVLSVHHDISTVTGEEVVLFTLANMPVIREAKKR
jgi:uncharacterized protein YbcI